MGDNKNLILAAVLSFLVIGLWDVFIIGPQREEAREAARIQAEREASDPTDPGTGVVSLPGAPGNPVALDRNEALGQSERVEIDAARVDGSISLTGARLDDLNLKDYRVTIDEDSPEVTLLSPARGQAPYYALVGWFGANAGPLPGPETEWTKVAGDTLGTNAPVTLEWENGEGLTYRQTYEMDENYLVSVRQEVENGTDRDIALRPYGVVARHGEPDTLGFFLLHEGAIGAFDGATEEVDYDDFEDMKALSEERGRPTTKYEVAEDGWIGFTDKYWLTALVPPPGTSFTGVFQQQGTAGAPVYRAEVRMPPVSIPAGGTAESTLDIFAGAKEAELLAAYEERLGIDRFYEAIDWGWFHFFTKPLFWLLKAIHNVVGNFGVAIILLTVLVKAVMFPLAYKSYVSMAKVKKLQPEMEKIRARHKQDPQAMQRAMMELYKREKANPAAGCLPLLVQIPVFFALYKVLFVTIEMRHAPFFGWIEDLSAPDPTSIFTGFGLLDYEVPALLMIGIWPIIMGITMWLQMQLNPAPPDPIQKKIFAWLPVIFTLMLGSFPAGLVIYWTANNVLTIVQQAGIMKSQGVKIELWDNLKGMFSRKKKTSG